MAAKMILRIITKNHAAEPEIGFLAKSNSKSNDCATAMPAALELIVIKYLTKTKIGNNFWSLSSKR